MTDKQLEDRFLFLSCSQLHDLYYQSGETREFSHTISEALNFKQNLDYPSQKFTCPIEHAQVFNRLVMEYGNILYRYEKSDGSWRDFNTVAELTRNCS